MVTKCIYLRNIYWVHKLSHRVNNLPSLTGTKVVSKSGFLVLKWEFSGNLALVCYTQQYSTKKGHSRQRKEHISMSWGRKKLAVAMNRSIYYRSFCQRDRQRPGHVMPYVTVWDYDFILRTKGSNWRILVMTWCFQLKKYSGEWMENEL